MTKYEKNQNPYTLTFGSTPIELISRAEQTNDLINKINSNPPFSRCYVITGVRGSGKTVMLNTVRDQLQNSEEWLIVEANPEDDIREAVASKLYSIAKLKKLFIETEFSFSFKGFSFSIKGKNPLHNIEDLLEKMLVYLSKKNKKVLILIDEISNNQQLKVFALTFQQLIRKGCQLYLLMTGVYENVSSLENVDNLTFLLRSSKTYLSALNINAIAASYEANIGLSREESLSWAKLTKGYAFAFQLLGYYLYEKRNSSNINVIGEYDTYLAEYVYNKIWRSLSPTEKEIVLSIGRDEPTPVKDIMEKLDINKTSFSKYRDRLIKKGVLMNNGYGIVQFSLPRFREYLDTIE